MIRIASNDQISKVLNYLSLDEDFQTIDYGPGAIEWACKRFGYDFYNLMTRIEKTGWFEAGNQHSGLGQYDLLRK